MEPNLRDYFYEDATPLEWARANAVWMHRVPDDIKLSALSIPGTHNTCALYGGFSRWGQCQSLSLRDQLDIGIRFLDIRCRHIENVFAIHHGLAFQHLFFGDVLQICLDFLRDHPLECIILSLKREHTDERNTRSFDATFQERYLRETRDFWYISSQIPVLGRVRGKIVLVSREAEVYGIPWNSLSTQDEFTVTDLFESIARKWNFVRAKLEETNAGPPGTWHVNFASAAGQPGIEPHQVAPEVNRRLNEYLSRRSLTRTGTLLMDYPGERLIDRIIQVNFVPQEIEGRRLVRKNSDFILQNANGKFVTTWKKGSYYWPQYGDSVLEAEPFRLGGDSGPLATGQEVQILTTNTGGMDDDWRHRNQLATFGDGVGYWQYAPEDSDERKSWWAVESAVSPRDGKPIYFDDAVRLKNVWWQQYLHLYPGKSYLWTKLSLGDDTQWIFRRGRITITGNWADPVDLGGGWGDYRHAFYGGKGIIYALTEKGEFHYYRDRGASSPPGNRWAARRVLIGGGFAPLRHAFSGDRGIVYTVDEGGILRYYRDAVRDDTTGGARWANRGQGLTIGRGWAGFRTVLGGGNGIIYAIQPDGRLLLYLDQAQDDTTPEDKRWAGGGASSKIGSNWGGFSKVFYGGSGVLYALTSDGKLLYYQDGLRAHGTDNRWLVEGAQIGSGWNRYVSVSSLLFAGEEGEIYVVTGDGRLLYFRNRS